MDSRIADYGADISSVLNELLYEHVAGVYLHGSLTMGAFVPNKSDVDVIATLNSPLNDTMRDELRSRVGSVSLPSVACGLDLTLLSKDVARRLTEDACWEAAIQVIPAHGYQTALELERSDPFLFIDVAVLRQCGTVMAGPSIEVSFAPVAPRLILRACAENSRVWANRDVFHDPSSGVLNVCRAWHFLEMGTLVSKSEAGEWARSKLGNSALVDAALAVRRGDTSQPLPDADVKDFCQHIVHLFENRGLP